MPQRALKKRGSKPPIRRVPPEENRTARDRTLGCSVTADEKEQVIAIAKALGFKSASAFLRYIVDNMTEMTRNPMHAMAWEADMATRVAKANGLTPNPDKPYRGLVTPENMAAAEARVSTALKETFGEDPIKRAEAASAASTSSPEARHDT